MLSCQLVFSEDWHQLPVTLSGWIGWMEQMLECFYVMAHLEASSQPCASSLFNGSVDTAKLIAAYFHSVLY